MSDPSLSDIAFKNKMDLVWTTLKFSFKSIENSTIRKSKLVVLDGLDPSPKVVARYTRRWIFDARKKKHFLPKFTMEFAE